MTDMTRAEELVKTIERDGSFRSDVEAAPTVAAKRAVLDAHGFQDVDLDDMRVYVERNGGTLVLRQGEHELSEQELAAIAGGFTDAESAGIVIGATVGGTLAGIGIMVAASAV